VDEVWLALGLTTFAGLATGIGSVIAFGAKRSNYRFLAVATGFSAGVMLYVSFVELFPQGASALEEAYGESWGMWVNVLAFFGGIVLMAVIDFLIPSAENPHETHAEIELASLRGPATPATPAVEVAAASAATLGPVPVQGAPVSAVQGSAAETYEATARSGRHSMEPEIHQHGIPGQRGLMRMGLFTALAIGIHNFPEGLATFLAVLQDPGLGLAIAIAIALHNIPEGISVSVPIYYATGNRRRAFLYSVASGLSEPVGAVIGYLLLRAFLGSAGEFPSEAVGIMFGVVAGIMVYISLDELLPTSRAYGKGHDTLFGLVGGMAVMALSLLLLA
jgi:ZIP family zinc transporter